MNKKMRRFEFAQVAGRKLFQKLLCSYVCFIVLLSGLLIGPETGLAQAASVTAITAGGNYSVALKSDGSVVAWGFNAFGQTTVPTTATSGVIAVAAGAYHTVALKSDGSIVAWGFNAYGQTTIPAGASSGVTAIAAGGYNTAALRGDGSVVLWGNLTTVPENATSGVIAIAAGRNHMLALKSDGSVVAWGENYSGQATVPTEAGSGIVAIAAGGDHSAAVKADGSVVAWGSNMCSLSTVPSQASSAVVAIALGEYHSLALKTDGSIVAWGCNSLGQITLPNDVSSNVTSISAGSNHSLAIKTDGSLVGWGANGNGETSAPLIGLKPLGAVPDSGSVSITSDVGGVNCIWSGTALSGTCTSEILSSGTHVVLTAIIPTMSEGYLFSWGAGCDSITATTCTINSLTMTTTISPAVGRLPDAPTIYAVTSSDALATISFTPPVNDGGLAITNYTVTSNSGDRTASGAVSPLTVSGLTPGISYTFTVTATNAVGTGPASAASDPVVIARKISSTALSSSLNPSIFGSSLTLTSSITGTNPTGTVTFKDGSNVLGTGTLSGSPATATFVTTALSAGVHSLTAEYSGDNNNEPSSSVALTQNVQNAGATMLLLDSDAGSWVGQGHYYQYSLIDGPFSVWVYPSNMIYVSFHTPTNSYFWNLSFSAANGGLITAGTYTGASSSATENAPALNVSSGDFPSCSSSNNSFDVREVTYGTDGQIVSFWAIFEQHCDGEFPALRGEIRINANAPNSATLISSPADPGVIGAPLTLSALVAGVSGTPTGTVIFKDGPIVLGTATLSGSPAVASLTTTSLAVGTHAISAVYEGDGSFGPSNSLVQEHVVQEAGKSLLIAQSDPGEFIGQGAFYFSTLSDGTFRAKKSTRMYSNGVYASFNPWNYYSLPRNYNAVLSVDFAAPNGAPLTVGTYTQTKRYPSAGEPGLNVEQYRSCSTSTGSFEVKEVSYGPNDDIQSLWLIFEQYCDGASAALRGEIRFNADAPNNASSISSSLNPSVFGQTVTLTATVKSSISAPTGTVTFKNDSVVLGTGMLAGDPAIATYTSTSLPAGTHAIEAVYDGSGIFEPSTSGSLKQKVKSVLTVSKSGWGSVVVNSGSMSWNGNIGTAAYDLNSSVILSTSAGPGYIFSGWDGDCTGTSPSLTVVMDASIKSCTATFIPATSTISTSVGTNGSVSPSSAQVTNGSSTTFLITPDPGYHISSVTGCGGNLIGNTYYTGIIMFDCTVTASFAEDTPSLVSTSAGPHGTIIPSSFMVNYGSTTTFTITPDPGYHITAVAGCGGMLNANSYITGQIYNNCAVQATFAPNTPTAPSHDIWTRIGPDGGSIGTIAIDPLTTTTLYVGTCWGGIYKSIDSGTHWTELDAGTPLSGVDALALDPITPTSIYASVSGGIIKSSDGGATWNPSSNGMISASVSTLVIDPIVPSTIYAGTSDGVFKSTDGGANWLVMNAGLTTLKVSTIAIDPVTSTTLYAGTKGGGVFKTTDGGLNWTMANTSLADLYIAAIVVDPITPETVYAATPSGVCKSTNGGETWTTPSAILSNLNTLAIDPNSPATLYASTHTGAYKSTDSGATWQMMNGAESGGYIYSFIVDPITPSRLYAGADSGVLKSTDSGATWAETNTGLRSNFVYAVAIDPQTSTTLYASTLEKGIFKSSDSGSNWAKIANTSANVLVVDPVTTATLYAGTVSGVLKSVDNGASWLAANTGMMGHEAKVIAIDPVTPSILYSGSSLGRIFKTTDGGQNWTTVKADACYLEALAVDPVVSTTVYAGTNGCGLLKSTDSGLTWTATNIGSENNVVGAIVIDPTAPGTVYVTADIKRVYNVNSKPTGIYKSIDGGKTWVALSAGLPHAYTYALTINPIEPSTVYAATADGVYVSTDGGASWATANDGLVNYVYALAIDPISASILYAGAHGGVYSTTIQPILTVMRSGNGNGTVSSGPEGIVCGTDCTEAYTTGSMVTLAASPASGSVFTGWSGDCSGAGTCQVTMNAAKYVTATFVAISPATGATLSADPASSQLAGSSATFTAGGKGGSGTYEYHFRVVKNGALIAERSFGTSNTWTWDTTGVTPNTYTVQVRVRNAGSTSAYEAYHNILYSVAGSNPATGATLSANPANAQIVGNAALFTGGASGGSGSYEYRFRVLNNGTEIAGRSYDALNTWTWNTTGVTPGTYTVQVRVRNAGSAADYESFRNMQYTVNPLPATGATLTANPGSSQLAGSSVLFAATGSGGTGTYEYHFRVVKNGALIAERTYNSTNTWTWDTTGVTPNTYTVQVRVRSAGSTAAYEAYHNILYSVVSSAPATGATLSADPASPQTAGSSVLFTSTGSGGSGSYDYHFRVVNNGTLIAERPYSATTTWTWDTTGVTPGDYIVQVRVRNQGSSADYEAYKNIKYAVVSP